MARPAAIAELIAKLLHEQEGTARKPDGALSLRVCAAFEAIGPPITRHAEPSAYKKGVLYLRVGHSGWLTELGFLREQLKQRINQALGREAVREVRLSLGALDRATEKEVEPLPPLTASDAAVVEACADAIGNTAVKEAVRRAAAACLATGRGANAPPTGPAGPVPTPQSPPPEDPNALSYGWGSGTRDRWREPRRKRRRPE